MSKKKANTRPINEIVILMLLWFSIFILTYAMTAELFLKSQQTSQVWTLVSILVSNIWTHLLRNILQVKNNKQQKILYEKSFLINKTTKNKLKLTGALSSCI